MRNEIDLDRIDTAMEPPEYEPMRQYYYMAKCRELLREAELRTGRKQTAYNLCLGCQMNTEIENVQKRTETRRNTGVSVHFCMKLIRTERLHFCCCRRLIWLFPEGFLRMFTGNNR